MMHLYPVENMQFLIHSIPEAPSELRAYFLVYTIKITFMICKTNIKLRKSYICNYYIILQHCGNYKR